MEAIPPDLTPLNLCDEDPFDFDKVSFNEEEFKEYDDLLGSDKVSFNVEEIKELAELLEIEEVKHYPCVTCKTYLVLKGEEGAVEGNYIQCCRECHRLKYENVKLKNKAEAAETNEGYEQRLAQRLKEAQGKDKHFFARRFCNVCKVWARYSVKSRKCRCSENCSVRPFLQDKERFVDRHIGTPRQASRQPRQKKSASQNLGPSCQPKQLLWSEDDAHITIQFPKVSQRHKQAQFAKSYILLTTSGKTTARFPLSTEFDHDSNSYLLRFNARKVIFSDSPPKLHSTAATILFEFPKGKPIILDNALTFLLQQYDAEPEKIDNQSDSPQDQQNKEKKHQANIVHNTAESYPANNRHQTPLLLRQQTPDFSPIVTSTLPSGELFITGTDNV